jgi:hypothetical protein
MRNLIIGAILTATTAPAHTASATVITYTLNNADMNSLTTGLGVFAGTLSGDFAVNGTMLVSADITASAATVSSHSFPGFEYTYGIAGANSTLTNGLGQAEPNFRLDSGANELELAWPTGNLSATGISGFDPNHAFEEEPAGGNRFLTSGSGLDGPVPAPVPSPGPLASLVLLALGIFLLTPRGQAARLSRPHETSPT